MLFSLLRFYGRDALNIRTLAFLVTLFLLTFLFAFGLPSSDEEAADLIFQPVDVSFVDEDHSIISYTLIDQFRNLDAVDAIHVESFEQAQSRLARGEILLIMVFPEDFYLDTLRGIERSSITVYLNEAMPAEATVFVRLLEDAAASVVGIQSALYAYADQIEPLYDDPQLSARHVEAASVDMAFRLVGRRSLLRVDPDRGLDTVRHVTSALSVLLTMLTSLLLITQVRQERQSGLHERLLAANAKPWRMALAKQILLLFWLLLGLVPLLAFLNAFQPQARLLLVMAGLGLLCLASSAWLMALTYLAPARQTVLLVGWIVILLLALAGGVIYPYVLLPGWLQTISVASPARWGYLLLYDEIAGRPLRQDSFIALGLMLGLGQAVATWAAARAEPDPG